MHPLPIRLWRWSLAACLLTCVGCWRAPQLGDDESAWKETEALYTAVTARRTELVDASTLRLADLHESGRIPTDVYKRLDAIAQRAKAGQWEPAGRELWHLMRKQRKG